MLTVDSNGKVAICLMTYMQERYINDTLQSIINQTYENIELIILDDGSTDNTVNIIKSRMNDLKNKFDRVVFIEHNSNIGNIPHNCNELIEQATADYIKEFSGDDIMLPDCIEKLVNTINVHKDAAVIHSNGFVEGDSYHLGDECSWNLFYD